MFLIAKRVVVVPNIRPCVDVSWDCLVIVIVLPCLSRSCDSLVLSCDDLGIGLPCLVLIFSSLFLYLSCLVSSLVLPLLTLPRFSLSGLPCLVSCFVLSFVSCLTSSCLALSCDQGQRQSSAPLGVHVLFSHLHTIYCLLRAFVNILLCFIYTTVLSA